jgi:hypothetical protein
MNGGKNGSSLTDLSTLLNLFHQEMTLVTWSHARSIVFHSPGQFNGEEKTKSNCERPT